MLSAKRPLRGDQTEMAFTVAIDGPAAAGKGTIAREAAAHFGFGHLDSGMLYRAVGKATLNRGRGVIDPIVAEEIAKHLSPEDLAQEGLRSPVVSKAASRVATLPEVRAALLRFQRKFARRDGGAVIDGRDIGTVVCPEAEVKIYITASDAVRARRRFDELTANGAQTTLEKVSADLKSRDALDAGRKISPMKVADDAHLLDTTELSIDAAVAEAVALITKKLEQGQD